jgi:plastocyanin
MEYTMRRICFSIAVFLSLSAMALLAPGAASAGGGCHGGRPVTDERSTTVTMSGNCFVATITRIDAGATVTFLNEDDAAHMVTGANFSWGIGADGNEGAGELFKGDTFEQTFADSGVYPYFCILHPSMVGAVVVGDGASALGDESTMSQWLASTGAQSQRGEASAAEQTIQDDSAPSRAMTLGVIGAGVALLAGIVLARTLGERRASAR